MRNACQTRSRIGIAGRRSSDSRRAGFTLLELMVALAIGGLVVATVFTLGGASSRHFQEQQRVGVTQRSVRMAMDRLRRDIARAGYLGVSDTRAPNVRTCPQLAPPQLSAIHFQNDDPVGNGALEGLNRAANRVSADLLQLTGNYATSEAFRVRGIDQTGTFVHLQTEWLSFRRAFMPAGTPNQAVFTTVFTPGRRLHIETDEGAHLFVTIRSATWDAAGPRIGVTPAIPIGQPCVRDGRGLVTPFSTIQYQIAPAGPALTPRNAAVTGPNTVLYRTELDADGTVMSARPILEFAIDFNLDFIVDTNLAPGQPPALTFVAGSAAAPIFQTSPWRVRSVIASLAARTPEQDPRFAWPGSRGPADPLNRFLVFPGQPGAARVRQLRTEVHLPNLR